MKKNSFGRFRIEQFLFPGGLHRFEDSVVVRYPFICPHVLLIASADAKSSTDGGLEHSCDEHQWCFQPFIY